MAISKIILNGVTQMDLTSDTVAANNLISPNTAHDAAGLPVVGTATAGVTPSGTISITSNGSHDVTQYASAEVNVPTGSTINNQNKTVTPSQSQQSITADSGYTGLGTVTVNAISSTYVGSRITRQTYTEEYALDGLDGEGGYVFVPAGYYAEDAVINVGTINPGSPSISVNSSTGLITSSYDINSGGWLASNNIGTRSSTQQLSTQAAATITPNETLQTAVAAGKYTTGGVTVAAIPNDYIGSGITQRDETDLTASGATVTVPAGYYASEETKSVASGTAGTPTAAKGTVSNHSISITPSVTNTAGYITGGTVNGTAVTVTASELVSGTLTINSSGTKDVTNYASASVASGSAATPASTITANPSISVNSSGLITATVSGSKSITPTVSAGYVSAGTAGTVTVSGSDTSQLTTLGATAYNTSTTNQTISSGRYLTGIQTIRAVTTSGITAANIKAGTTVSVGDSADADRILSVTGTFTGDATAAASDIVSGQTAYVNGSKVTGSLVVQTYYTGSSAPSSSLGVNGDIYIQA